MHTFEALPPSIGALARFAAIAAVTGNHSALLVGPPGTGHTMLARRAAAVLPGLDEITLREHVDMFTAAGLAERLNHDGVVPPPVRMPHHTVSLGGMVGTAAGKPRPLPPTMYGQPHGPMYRLPARPGEIALAHGGLLFLDECPEFSHEVLCALAEIRREGHVHRWSFYEPATIWPARFALLASTHACPCGFLGHPDRACVCPPRSVARYLQRLVLPFDMVVDASAYTERPAAPQLGFADSDTIAGAVASARRELARLDRPLTLHDTVHALGIADPEPVVAALQVGRARLEQLVRTGEAVPVG